MLLSTAIRVIYLSSWYKVFSMPTAFVLIKCEEEEISKIKRGLDKTKVIMDVQPTVGHYDLVAQVTSPEIDRLNDIIEKIHGNDKVHSTKVLLKISDTGERDIKYSLELDRLNRKYDRKL